MLVVTGATGQLGRIIVEKLLELVSAREIGVSVRDPEKARDLVDAGIRVRRGDFSDPPSLAASFEGARRVLIVSSNAAATGGDPLAHHRAAITAACEAGVQHILYTSHAAAGSQSAFPPCRDHAVTEAMLAACGTGWTALRHGFYAESASIFLGDWRNSGVIAAPLDGPIAWTTHADLGAADALMLSQDHLPTGPTAPLTGTEALDLDAVGAIAAELRGATVRREIVPDADLANRFAARGAPPAAVAIALGFYEAARTGEFACVDSTLGELLGRAPGQMRDVLAAQMR